MGMAFTTWEKSMRALEAALASGSFTVDIRYAGTFGSISAPTALYTPMVVDSGTDAIMRPSAALIAVSWASEHTPLAGRPEMAEAWASAPSFMNGYAAFESLAAASPIASAWAFPAAPNTAAAHAAAGALGFPAGAGTKTVLRSMVAATAATMRATLRCWAIALGLRAKKNALSDSGAAVKPKETLSQNG